MELIPVCVLIVEKHPLMREALSAAISDEPDMKAGMKATSGMEALQLLKVILPDLILFAVSNPGLNELEALTALRHSLPVTPILALTSNEVLGQEQAALQAGACAVLTKAATRLELIEALREIRISEIGNDSNVEKEEPQPRPSSLTHVEHKISKPDGRLATLQEGNSI